jgi:hypothetical protein
VGIAGDLYIGGKIVNAWNQIHNNVDLAVTTSFNIPTGFRRMTILVRSYGLTVGSTARFAFRTGTTVAGHVGATGTSAWPPTSVQMGTHPSSDTCTFTMDVTYTGLFNSFYNWVCSGGFLSVQAAGANANCGEISMAGATGLIDNILFSTSAGAYSKGRVSIYVMY